MTQRCTIIRGGARLSIIIGAIALVGATACGGSSEPAAAPLPKPPAAKAPPPPPPPPAASSAKAEPPPPPQNETVIHEAYIHAKIKARAGKRVVLEPLLTTSETLPQKGNKGGLYRVLAEVTEGKDLLLIADVEIAESMVQGKNIQIDIVDEKKDALVDGKKVNHFIPGTKVRLRYDW